jgi:hypothetical protein
VFIGSPKSGVLKLLLATPKISEKSWRSSKYFVNLLILGFILKKNLILMFGDPKHGLYPLFENRWSNLLQEIYHTEIEKKSETLTFTSTSTFTPTLTLISMQCFQ